MGDGVFISYRRADAGPHAAFLHEALTNRLAGTDIFMDVDDIQPGDDFRQAIDGRLAASAVLLVVIGPTWLDATDSQGLRRLDREDDFVRFEVERALERGLPVIPVLVGGAAVPAAAELPSSIASLCDRQAAAVRSDSPGADAARLAEAIARRIAAGPPPPPEPLDDGVTRFDKVWCWQTPPQKSVTAANRFTGQLAVDDTGATFTGSGVTLELRAIQRVELGKAGTDPVNTWVAVTHLARGAEATVWLGDARNLGFRALLGGPKRIYAALKPLEA